MGETVAYIRVSTDRQDALNQRNEILNLANEKDLGKVHLVEEVVSGRKRWRDRALGGIVEKMKPNDAIVVAELSRLGRSMLEIMEILNLALERKIRVYAAKGKWELGDSLQSKILAMVFAMAAEIERDLISQRTKNALATKKSQGVRLGRPKGPGKSKLDGHREDIIEYLSLGVTKKRVAERFGTTPLNLRIWLKKRGIVIESKGPEAIKG